MNRGEIFKKGKKPVILAVVIASAMFLIVFNFILPLLQKPTYATTGTSISKSTTADWDLGTTSNLNTAGDEMKMMPNPRTAWYQTGGTWNYRKKIIIDHTKVPNTDQTDFPVLINLATDADLASKAQDDGDDILITSDDQTTKLSHEIESFDGATGALVLWVKIPLLSHTYDTTVYMYYGNASATSQQDATAVWSNGYAGVWHLDDASSTTVNDSTSSPVNGTKAAAGQPVEASAKIGPGQTFVSANTDYITLGSNVPKLMITGAQTVSAWVKGGGTIYETAKNWDYGFWMHGGWGGGIRVVRQRTGGIDDYQVGSIVADQWNYVTVSYDGAGNYIFRTNDTVVNQTGNNSATIYSSPAYSDIGQTYPPNHEYLFNGTLDEIKVSNTARSADWIATEYANQNDPSTFYSLKTETARTSVFIAGDNVSTDWYSINETAQMDWKYRRQITIDHTKVPNTNQSEFPMLVKIADSTDPIFTKAQADGDDILFTNSPGTLKLSHEIETFNTTTKELWAWVKIPTLKTASDTIIWLYYGNAAATSQQNATGVWSNGYAGVWHLNETGTNPVAYDSTTNNFDSTSQTWTPDATGKIGGGAQFIKENQGQIITSLNSQSTDFTTEIWFNDPGGNGEVRRLLDKSYSGGFWLGVATGVTDGSYGGGVKETNPPYGIFITLPTNQWNHIASTRSGTTHSLIGNGGAATTSNTVSSAALSSDFFSIAGPGDLAYWMSVYVDEVRYSSVARSADWIATEYNNQNAPETFEAISKESAYYPTAEAVGWYATGGTWTGRQKVTIDHTKVPNTDQTDFPVLIKITNQSNGVFASAQADGDDILFTSSNGTTKLSHEIETYTTTAGSRALWAWVKVPTLATATDTVLYMYYGNAAATSQQSATAVWSNGYVGVWHLGEASGTIYDSTSNNNDSSWQSLTYGASGKVGKAGSFDGGSNWIQLPLMTSSIDNISLSSWVKGSVLNQYRGGIVGIGNGATGYNMMWGCENNSRLCLLYAEVSYGNSGYDFALDTWYHVVSTIEYETVGTVRSKATVNGAEIYNAVRNNPNTPSGYSGIGRELSSWSYFSGLIDESHVSSVRSADWIATEYNNQNGPETFMSFSMEASNVSYASPTATGGGSGIINTVWNGGWGTPVGFASNVTIPNNTMISFQIRSSAVGGSSDGDWTAWADLGTATLTGTYTVANASMPAITLGTNKYLQVRSDFISDIGDATPTLSDYTIYYLADTDAPTNPTTVTATVGGGAVTSGTWINTNGAFNFVFSGASDGGGGESGVAGYYVYLGTNASADPAVDGVYQAHVGALGDNQNYNSTIAVGDDGKHYHFIIKTKDVAGNVSASGDLFNLGYDITLPTRPTFVAADPAGYTTVNSFDFTWPAGTDPDGPNGASGIKWYEYKRATDGAWSHTANAATRTATGILAYQEGANAFYVRTIDNASNTSSNYQQVTYYWSGVAPAKPDNLAVTPDTSDSNSFTVTWDKPAVGPGDPPVVGYYYSINAAPTISNVTYVASEASSVSIGPDAYATLQGVNTIYVLSVNSAGNLSYEAAYYATDTFTCVTPAPPAPTSVSLYDSSDRTLNRWMLTIQWVAGAGQDPATFDHYAIYRSTDGLGFSLLATTTSTAYIDASGLNNTTTYFYNIKAVDNAAKEGAQSSTVSKMPTGNYLTPPTILSGPTVTEIKASGAKVSWTNDRASSSIVRYGTVSGTFSASTGQFDSVTNHSVTLLGLTPGTVHYFQVQSLDEHRDYSQESAYSGTLQLTTLPAPAISNVKVANITLTAADISWETTTVAHSTLSYGQTNGYGASVDDQSGSGTTSHNVKLSSLESGTTYHFKISGTDADNNILSSDDYQFDTLPLPKIENLKIETVSGKPRSAFNASWTTNVPATTVLKYRLATTGAQASACLEQTKVCSTGSGVAQASACADTLKCGLQGGGEYKEQVAAKLEIGHAVEVTGLLDDSIYQIIAEGRDSIGNLAQSAVQTFKTPLDTRAPVVSNVRIESSLVGADAKGKNQVVVRWDTDEPTTSQVEYGEGTDGGYTGRTNEESNLIVQHTVTVNGLEGQTPYHLRVISKDRAANITESQSQTFTTGEGQSNIWQMITRVLGNLFGFVQLH